MNRLGHMWLNFACLVVAVSRLRLQRARFHGRGLVRAVTGNTYQMS